MAGQDGFVARLCHPILVITDRNIDFTPSRSHRLVIRAEKEIEPAALDADTIILYAAGKGISSDAYMSVIEIQKIQNLKIRHIGIIFCKGFQLCYARVAGMHLHKMWRLGIHHKLFHRSGQVCREKSRKRKQHGGGSDKKHRNK